MLELLLQVEQNVVVGDVQLVLAPQEAHLLQICQDGTPNYAAVGRTLPAQHDFTESVDSGLVVLAVEGLLLQHAQRLVGFTLQNVAFAVIWVLVEGQVVVGLCEVCQGGRL